MTDPGLLSMFSVLNIRGCHIRCRVVLAGSRKLNLGRSVQLLTICTGNTKWLPRLSISTNHVGMPWERTDNSVVLAGDDQDQHNRWSPVDERVVTDEMFLLTNGAKNHSKWKPLPCKLPSKMTDPHVLFSDTHLYLLGSDNHGINAKRIPKSKLKPESVACNWENLENLHSKLKSNDGTGGGGGGGVQ